MRFDRFLFTRNAVVGRSLSIVIGALLLSACDPPAPAPVAPAVDAPTVTGDAASARAGTTPEATAARADAAAPAKDAAAEQMIDERIDRLLGDHQRYRAVFEQFQQAVAAHDAVAVAALVDYPFTATIDGKRVVIDDAAGFAARYREIVTPAIATVIAGQRYADLMVNAWRDVRQRRSLVERHLQRCGLQALRCQGGRDPARCLNRISISTRGFP